MARYRQYLNYYVIHETYIFEITNLNFNYSLQFTSYEIQMFEQLNFRNFLQKWNGETGEAGMALETVVRIAHLHGRQKGLLTCLGDHSVSGSEDLSSADEYSSQQSHN